MLRRIDRIILRVESLPSAVQYYRDVLGLKLLRHDPKVAAFQMSDGQTELILRADPDQPAEEIYFLVDDVRDLYARRSDLKLKFVQPPRQAAHGYRAAVKDPFGNVLLLLDRSTESAGSTTVEDASAPTALFPGIESRIPTKRTLLIQIYEQIARTADDLPYTPQFEQLFNLYSSQIPPPKPTHQEVWRHLLNLRKGGKLPRLGEARSDPIQISPDAEATLRKLLGTDIGKRDRLPYTDRFDKLVDQFNQSQSRPLSPHLVWRLVAKLSK
jgi:catechol 2,3-dioxygenase-like lactoylglutathione lyase family enzyme